jgi:hypothetical protein
LTQVESRISCGDHPRKQTIQQTSISMSGTAVR